MLLRIVPDVLGLFRVAVPGDTVQLITVWKAWWPKAPGPIVSRQEAERWMEHGWLLVFYVVKDPSP